MKIVNGIRYYGERFGSTGVKEDPTKCIAEVCGDRWYFSYHQCTRKRGHGKDGLYCKIHDPERKKEKEAEKERQWEKERKEQRDAFRRKQILEEMSTSIPTDDLQYYKLIRKEKNET